MIFREVLFIKKLLNDSEFLAFGSNSICFKKNDEVIKIYFRHNFHKNEIIDVLNKLNEYSNDTFITPNEILSFQGICVGYKMNYIDAKSIKNISGNIYDLFYDFENLALNVKENSNKGFILGDVHYNNILFNGKYYLIDLDNYSIQYNNFNDIFNRNMNDIIDTILYSIFGIDKNFKFYYYRNEYTVLRGKIINDYKYFYNFIDMLVKDCNSEDIYMIRKKAYRDCIINSNFKSF